MIRPLTSRDWPCTAAHRYPIRLQLLMHTTTSTGGSDGIRVLHADVGTMRAERGPGLCLHKKDRAICCSRSSLALAPPGRT